MTPLYQAQLMRQIGKDLNKDPGEVLSHWVQIEYIDLERAIELQQYLKQHPESDHRPRRERSE